MESYMIEFEEEGIKHVKMFVIITLAYIIFWGPLFVVTLINISLDWKDAKSSVSHEVSFLFIYFKINKGKLWYPLFIISVVSKGNISSGCFYKKK